MNETATSTMPTRRAVLGAAAGGASIVILRPALAAPDSMAAAIRAFVGEAPLRTGRVNLEVPLLVENGHSVPLKVAVESPMTALDHVRTIAVFNEKNPLPNVAEFHLSPRSGRADISTRIRLGDSQKVVAIAQMSDGTFWQQAADVIVTLPACAES